MQQFTVPQFIDVESKIIGPITTRQFLIFLATAAIIGIFYKLFDFTLFLATGIPVLGIAVLFAFVKINGQPFHLFVVSIVRTLRRPGTRVWNNQAGLKEIPEVTPIIKNDYQPQSKPEFASSHLADLSLVVDTKGRYQGGESDQPAVKP
jgi:hypothetical protein